MKRIYSVALAAILMLLLVMAVAPSVAWSADSDAQFKAAMKAGDEFVTSGKFQEALVEYKKALKLNPNDADANYKVGVANYFLRDYPAATEAYKKAIELNPKHFKALNNLGMIYDKENKNREATQMFEQALAADPQYKKARYNLGRVLYKRAMLNQAELVAAELIKAFPDDEEASYLMGLIYEHSDKYDQAKEMYTKASRLSTLNKDCEESTKRLNERIKSMETKKQELTKAREMVSFKLPNGYEFISYQQIPSGAELVSVVYQTGGSMLLARMPETDKVKDWNLKTVLGKPDESAVKVFTDLGLADVALVEMKEADINNPEVEADTATPAANKREYAKITCTVKGQKNEGIMALVPVKGKDTPLLFVATAPEGRFDPAIARIFMINVGN